jgi:hypothetical protein
MGSTRRGYKSICLPFASEKEYQEKLEDKKAYRKYLNSNYKQYPELFPAEMKSGYIFCGFTKSKKQELAMRRIKIKDGQEVYQIRPSFMMPYMIGKTEQVEKALYLRRWGVPFDALAYVFGQDAMFWYRAYISLARPSIVGTTIKDPENLPKDLLADEKHTWLLGEKIYAATTVAEGCLLGVGIAESSGAQDLVKAYKEFQTEALAIDPNYKPETVNTDGWLPTQQAWQQLFPTITTILCFLHAFLKIEKRAKRFKELFEIVKGKAWNIYHSDNRTQFAQRIRRFREWAVDNIPASDLLSKVLELCSNSKLFQIAFDYEGAYRTSATLDRLMNYQDRILYAAQYFHGTLRSAKLYLRAASLLWNFHPYGSRTRSDYPNRRSPFEDLNGFRYHDNWLHNFLIASSLGGKSFKHKIR